MRHRPARIRREPVFDDCAVDGDERFARSRFEEDDVAPLPRARPFGRLRLALRLVVAAGIIAGLALAARQTSGPESAPQAWKDPHTTSVAKPARRVVPITSAGPVLALEPAAFEPPVSTELPRWSAATGLREDALAQGRFDAIDGPYLRLTVSDPSQLSEVPASLFVTLARRAADVRGLAVARTGQRGLVDTKFGPLETLDVTLEGEGRRGCTGFQSLTTRSVRIDGWLCGVLGQAPDAAAVTCAIDRLILSSGAPGPMQSAFADAEPRRASKCSLEVALPAGRDGDATGSLAPARPVQKAPIKKSAEKIRQNAQARPL